MSKGKQNFFETKHSNLVTRRNYAKFPLEFNEPNLLQTQISSYQNFIKKELHDVFDQLFPIATPKSAYRVEFEGLSLKPIASKTSTHSIDEKECRKKGITYAQTLYANLVLVNNELPFEKNMKPFRGEKVWNKPFSHTDKKNDKALGLFMCEIPLMTDKGTFIINGVEKFIISQIVRAPGVYALNKSQLKLARNKKKVNQGYICEMLPNRGIQINCLLVEKRFPSFGKKWCVNMMMRTPNGSNAPSFSATMFLKGLGLSQENILHIYEDNEFIINTLSHPEEISRNTVLSDPWVANILSTAHDVKNDKAISHSFKLDEKLKVIVFDYVDTEVELKKLHAIHVEKFTQHKNELADLKTKLLASSGAEAKSIQHKIDAIQAPIIKLIDEIQLLETKQKQLIDGMIVECCAKHIVSELQISFNQEDSDGATNYQDILSKYFMNKRFCDLSTAGRYKIIRKLRLTERLYGRIIAEDLLLNDGTILIKNRTRIGVEEVALVKEAIAKKKLVLKEIKILSTSKSKFLKDIKLESISVYADENCQFSINLLGIHVEDDSIAYCEDKKTHVYSVDDFIATISYTIGLFYDVGKIDDIDHLGNKHLRLIHEQLCSKIQKAITKTEKSVIEKLANYWIKTQKEEIKEQNAIKIDASVVFNPSIIKKAVQTFFNTYSLTQFVDQQNPLSEITNKRRISAMGEGGISSEDPNLDIRDVHYSHYGRICPIETPEGANIGLIMSLASFTRVDLATGFLETPYYKVVNGVITNEVEWLTSLKEEEYIIGESTTKRSESNQNKLVGEDGMCVCRYRSLHEVRPVSEINYIEISPRQVVSVATGSIPFLEHDDTTRALMGANMQRQAVPLIHPYAPIVGTGSEYKIAHDAGLAIIYNRETSGKVTQIDGKKITITDNDDVSHSYQLLKYEKSNQSTSINQTPCVQLGQTIKQGDVLADGPAMQNGELALGRNALVAFTTWYGYNYEDAIVISDRLVKEDVYTSIYIEELKVDCKRLGDKLGDEEITRDIPGVSDEYKRFLDENGIIKVGAEVKEGDILVGKVSPKPKLEPTPIEKLLFAISGNKYRNIEDTSLKVPFGCDGIVGRVDVLHTRDGDDLGDNTLSRVIIHIVQKRKIQIGDKMAGRHGNKGIVSIVVPQADMPHLEDGTPIDICLNPLGVPSRMNLGQVMELHLGLAMRQIAKKEIVEYVLNGSSVAEIMSHFGLSHTNAHNVKDVLSKYCHEHGISSATHIKDKLSDIDLFSILKSIGLSFEDLSVKATTPIFMGASLDDISNALAESNIDVSKTHGKFKLIDGRSGEYLDGEISVGVMYMMKLDHMVADKLHARSAGRAPYSRITQQPVGGRSQNGGQRFGEMEVWALEAYGAAYNLRELMTIKSDDLVGRELAYNSILYKKNFPTPSIPEAFKLLISQLNSLCLSVDVIKQDDQLEDFRKFIEYKASDEGNRNQKKVNNSNNKGGYNE